MADEWLAIEHGEPLDAFMADVDRSNPIIDAIDARESLDVVRFIVKENPVKLRQRNEEGYLPIHYAIKNALWTRPDIFRHLLEAWPESAHERTVDDESLLPAHLVCLRAGFLSTWQLREEQGNDRGDAAAAEALDVVRAVVEANPRALQDKDGKGRLPLHVAFEIDAPPLNVIRYLVEQHRPALQEKDDEGCVPLHCALRPGAQSALPVTRYLVEQRPESVRENSKLGETPLVMALLGGATIGVVRLMVSRCPDSVRDKDAADGRTPLHHAARTTSGGNAANVECLIAEWPEAAQQKAANGRLPLHEAANVGSVSQCRALVNCWPQALREKRNDGWLAVHEAASAGEYEAVRFFVDRWPESVREKTNDGWLPLHFAARFRPYDDLGLPFALILVQHLVRHFPESVWEATNEGYLPLHVAAGQGNLEWDDEFVDERIQLAELTELSLVRFLVDQAPTSVRALSKDGMLPVHYAFRSGHSIPAVQYLFESWPQDRTSAGVSILVLAIGRGTPQVEHVEFAIQRRPRMLQETDERGLTPLHYAVTHCPDLAVWQCLVRHRRESLGQRDGTGSLPLHLYVNQDGPALANVQYLVREHPEALEVANQHGSLPLHLAAARSGTPLSVVECLMEGHPGALCARDMRGSLPVHVAVSRGDASLGIVRLLVGQRAEALRQKNCRGFVPLKIAAMSDAPLDVLYYLATRDPESISDFRWVGESPQPRKRSKLELLERPVVACTARALFLD
jgi:ankyrin repeat protein